MALGGSGPLDCHEYNALLGSGIGDGNTCIQVRYQWCHGSQPGIVGRTLVNGDFSRFFVQDCNDVTLSSWFHKQSKTVCFLGIFLFF